MTQMSTTRLEAFSDGVIAIILTIMVLELHVPHQASLSALVPLWPVFLSYMLSFLYVGIYWNNHHHMLQVTQRVNGKILWANLHLLFWLSLIPFTSGWLGENHLSAAPTALYGVVLLMAAIAYSVLQHAIMQEHGRGSLLQRAVGRDWKGKISLASYLAAIGFAFYQQTVALVLYFAIAALWLVPDRRIEHIAAD